MKISRGLGKAGGNQEKYGVLVETWSREFLEVDPKGELAVPKEMKTGCMRAAVYRSMLVETKVVYTR